MKKLFFIIVYLLINTLVFAQHGNRNSEIKWLSIAVKGGYGGTVMFNSDIMADDNVTLDYLSPSYSYGGRIGITYGDHVGLHFEPLFSGFSQEYNINDGAEAYAKNQKFKSMDYLISLRYVNKYGFYFEAGPQFSTLKSASVQNSKDGNFTDEGENYIANFNEKFTSLVLGAGFAAYNGDRLQVNIGLRGTYTFGDIVAQDNFYILRDGVYNPSGTFTSSTNPFTLKFMVELNYFFGFWGDASCGRGRLMFFQ